MVIGVYIDGVAMVSIDGDWMTLRELAERIEGFKPLSITLEGVFR